MKDEAERRQPKRSARVLIERARRTPLHIDLAPGRQVQQPEQIEQRRFARTGRAGDGDEFARIDPKINVLNENGRGGAADHPRAVANLQQRKRRIDRHEAPLMISTGYKEAALRAGKNPATADARSATAPASR